MTTIQGKTVLLTGASRGIGVFIARELAKKQAKIVCVARSLDKLRQTVREIEAYGGEAIAVAFDITQLEQLPLLIQQIESQTGSIDILINNAGIEIYKSFADYSLSEIQSVLTINLVAAIEITRLVLPQMIECDRGHIVNIASLAGKKGHPYDSIYSASKAGLVIWADALRQELFKTNVAISTLCPGYVTEQGMLADTGIPAPTLAGLSTPTNVATAVIKAIENNQAEVIVNSNSFTNNLTKFLLAIEQFFPLVGDFVNRKLKVTDLNQQRSQQLQQISKIPININKTI